MKSELTIAQHFILNYASHHTDGKIVEFPENLKGGARNKVLESLLGRGFITKNGNGWIMTDGGYAAVGASRSSPTLTEKSSKARSTRENSKQAQVINMLKRPEGATIGQICEATGWQQHTVRGTFAGAFKKKLGLSITSEKPEGGERIYRIAG